MIIIKTTGLANAWKESLLQLIENGRAEGELFREDSLVLEIDAPNTELTSDLFPVDKKQIEVYRKYIIYGKNAPDKSVGTSALYYERLHNFDNIDQLNYVIEKLSAEPDSKRAQISFWLPRIDKDAKSVPCMQLLWFRLIGGKLNVHCHMRANDAYDKLLVNLNVVESLMEHVAKNLNVKIGKYVHIVDSFHVYKEDEQKVKLLIKKLV